MSPSSDATAPEGEVAARIRSKLVAAFAPSVLEIEDQSERHRGHSGFQEGGETHFAVRIVAPAFAEMSRIARQRAVYDCLSEELADRVHALSLDVSGP